ncbi:MAG: hypothetical protein A2289_19400 [Deltaproteobacteria bacterium RIFOXYA12_FULL_58_15]|nr:MAG: hypothetical protein A2289_19400 [Deltaproteobacteria bacterium RIFOXYA12_FULL_58_15]OGR09180.1 MAG: hypothetical protein A2341_24385 [Deltaproteobacteria bacterium RIFOXYB12_FULL_58_9]
MSKVVHLSEEAHIRAKDFCKLHSLRMSDWVATLIDEAITKGRTDTNVRTLVPKKKILEKLEAKPQMDDAGVPVYSRPPFWNSHKA